MIRRFTRNRVGTAATEFALTLPLMLALIFGSMEAGHFFWTQHKIVKSVRDGARFASRLDIERLCALAMPRCWRKFKTSRQPAN